MNIDIAVHVTNLCLSQKEDQALYLTIKSFESGYAVSVETQLLFLHLISQSETILSTERSICSLF